MFGNFPEKNFDLKIFCSFLWANNKFPLNSKTENILKLIRLYHQIFTDGTFETNLIVY